MAYLQDEAKMGENGTCDSCQIRAAKVFCACIGVRTYLCGQCVGDHTTVKYPDLMHQLVPMEANVSNVRAFRDRNEAFAAGRVELKQNLTRIDQCCEEIARAYNEVIGRLGQWRDYYVQGLQAWKVTLGAEIAEAENEVKGSLAQEEVQLRCKYSPLLRYFQPGTCQLFTFQIDSSGFEHLAKEAVKIQYADVPCAQSLARPEYGEGLMRLQQDRIESFDFQFESFATATRLLRPIALDTASRYTLVDANTVFCCGYRDESRAAYLVYAASGAVEDLPPLGVARACPGVLGYCGAVFAFGSWRGC